MDIEQTAASSARLGRGTSRAQEAQVAPDRRKPALPAQFGPRLHRSGMRQMWDARSITSVYGVWLQSLPSLQCSNLNLLFDLNLLFAEGVLGRFSGPSVIIG